MNAPRPHPFTRLALKSLGVAAGLAGSCAGLYFLIISRRAEGHLFGASATCLAIATLLATLACQHPRRRWRRSAVAALAGGVVCTTTLFIRAPDGRAAPTARVAHRYVGGDWRFRPHAPGNLLPELDQFRAGFPLVAAVDPLFTREQARKLSALTTAIYDQLEADPEFHALGSVMPDAYDELLGRPFERGHYFLYVPVALDRSKPSPALVFLHGSGGNFKAYTWLLAKLADRLGCVLVAPSHGMGNWREPATSRVIEAALADAERVLPLDPSRIHLLGLSNGGLGVSQAGAGIGRRFRSLTFLSPVIDTHAITSPEFRLDWRQRPVRILTGADDDRVPLAFVAHAAETMRLGGADVALRVIDGADHFLFFSHETAVLRQLETWLAPLLEAEAG